MTRRELINWKTGSKSNQDMQQFFSLAFVTISWNLMVIYLIQIRARYSQLNAHFTFSASRKLLFFLFEKAPPLIRSIFSEYLNVWVMPHNFLRLSISARLFSPLSIQFLEKCLFCWHPEMFVNVYKIKPLRSTKIFEIEGLLSLSQISTNVLAYLVFQIWYF